MPELLLELLSEEIPARMQARATDDLCRLLGGALAPIKLGEPHGLSGPRRIGVVMEVAARAETPAREERGPRVSAPEAALVGFLKKHGVSRDALTQVGDFWVMARPPTSIDAAMFVAREMPGLLWSFPWPKSMRWGVSDFTWVRPLQRILCLLDGMVVPFQLAKGADAAHGLTSGHFTEGHRVHSSGPLPVISHVDYARKLRDHFVLVDAAERAEAIRSGVASLASAEGLEVVSDEGLLAEVAGLVEWPVPMLGSIDPTFMDLPPEVMRTSMRVNQRYFSLRTPDGKAAPRFALVANIVASDGGASLVAGNERVLRARLSDARFFWHQDLTIPIESLLTKLEGVVFHAKLGTQGDRVRRLEKLAGQIALSLGGDPELSARAGRLCKADLVSGMVGEFPELQGVMGGYYAREAGEDERVAEAVANHYRPMGPADAVPSGETTIAVALADKLDQLAGFFAVGEKPTGAGDPFALRRAALGVIRIIREHDLRLPLRSAISMAQKPYEKVKTRSPEDGRAGAVETEILEFILDRLRIQLRAEGARTDILSAAVGYDDDIVRILAREDALRTLVESDTGQALLSSYKRAQNILRIEDKKDGPHIGPFDDTLTLSAEIDLLVSLEATEIRVTQYLAIEDFAAAAGALGSLRAPIDTFFEQVLVNDADPIVRKNRLRLLSRLKSAMDSMADLSKIEA